MTIIVEQPNIALESSLLSVMSLKRNYEQYNAYIDYKRVLPDTARLLNDYKKYFELYNAHEEINWELFYTQFSQTWHSNDIDSFEFDYYRDAVFPAIQKIEKQDVEACLLGLMQKHLLDEINKKSFDLARIRLLFDDYENKEATIIRTVDKEITTITNVDFNILDKTEGIPWCLSSLQAGLGSIVKGQLIVVSADFGTGKSGFVICQAACTLEWCLKHNKGCVLYFNSEGTEADVFGRLCSNLFRKQVPEGFEEIVNKREQIKEQFINRYGEHRFLVSQISHNSVEWVYNKILKYNPSLVIIDITDTLAKEEDVINLKKVFDRLRVIAGLTCPIIATTQSGDTSYYDKKTNEKKTRKWLSDKDLYGSKTGKGGAADTIITIGKDDRIENLRYINTPKKKRGASVQLTCSLTDKYSLFEELSW